MIQEPDIRYRVDRTLENKGWVLDPSNPRRNVFFESSLPEAIKRKLGRKRPDYTLFLNNEPVAVIEAKKTGADINKALRQGEEYANMLGVGIVFAVNGTFCKTKFLANGKELFLNGSKLNELPQISEMREYLQKGSNEIYTIPKEVIESREELIGVFSDMNDTLRSEGLRAGIERFSEFANILFLKLLSEHNENSYWNDIKNQRDEYRVDFINGKNILNRLRSQYGGDVFTALKIKKPQTLKTIIERLDPLSLTPIDTDIKGSAFEYFLQKTTSTQNDLGEYFTPRHIIKSVIQLVDPKLNEKIYDPFCGTGGFLTEAFRYIVKTNKIDKSSELNDLKQKCIFGKEITTTARIAKMNMILYGDGHSGVKQGNSLENPINGLYDVVLTNIPFSQKVTPDISGMYYNGISKKNGDGVCLLHCMRSVRNGGRMAVIVPEKILFDNSLKDVREFLLEHSSLHSVISLPAGCFLPYTNTKTNIIYLTDIEHKTTKNFWSFKVKNDGYSLNNQRKKILGESDLEKINSSSLGQFSEEKDDRNVFKRIGILKIYLEDIANNNFRLNNLPPTSFDKRLNLVFLKDCLEEKYGLQTGKRPKGGAKKESESLPPRAVSLGGEHINTDGTLDLKNLKYIPLEFYKKASYGKIKKNDILMNKDGALTGKVAMVRNEFQNEKFVMINEHVYIIRGKKEIVNQLYLFYALFSSNTQNQIKKMSQKTAQPGLNRQEISSLKIPLPSLREQNRIANEIEKYYQSVENYKEAIKKEKINFNKNVEKIWNFSK